MSLGMRNGGVFGVSFVCVGLALGGCDAVFGIRPGDPKEATSAGGGGAGGTGAAMTVAGGSGGVGGTTASGGSGGGTGGAGCGPFEGNGAITWTDQGGSNLPSTTVSVSGSVNAVYNGAEDLTAISLGAYVDDSYCSAGGHITFPGEPIAGQVYALVDQATFADLDLFKQGKNAFIDTGAQPAPPSGDCNDPDEKSHLFGSTAGVGTFTIESVEGRKVQFKAEGVVAVPIAGPDNDGTGTVGVEILAFANCYWDGT